MAVSKDYLETLKGLAQARYTADVGAVEGEFKRRAGGTVSGTGPQTAYKSPAQIAAEGGTPQYGELDIAYQRNREGLEGGLESRGILRSGQAATARGRMASDYQQSVLDYYNAMAAKKGALGAQLAFDVADLEAKYGTAPQTTAPERVVPEPKGPAVTDGTTPSSSKPASDRTPEEAAAFAALGQPADRLAATGQSPFGVPVALPIKGTTEPFAAAAYMALGQQQEAQPRPAAPAPKPATPPKPAAPARPTPPKPSPPPPPPKPAPKPAPVPVRKPTPVKMR